MASELTVSLVEVISMDRFDELRKLLDSGAEITHEDLVRLGVVRVVDDLTFQRNRLLEFQQRYNTHSYVFYRTYVEAPEELDSRISEYDAFEWARRCRLFSEAGGHLFSLPQPGAALTAQMGQAETSGDNGRWGQQPPPSTIL